MRASGFDGLLPGSQDKSQSIKQWLMSSVDEVERRMRREKVNMDRTTKFLIERLVAIKREYLSEGNPVGYLGDAEARSIEDTLKRHAGDVKDVLAEIESALCYPLS